MTMIDPSHRSAMLKFWDDATKEGDRRSVAGAVADCSNNFILRRTKEEVLKDKLPSKHVSVVNVAVRPSELGLVEVYEASLLKILNQLQDESDRRRQREMIENMMSCMAIIRMTLIHPSLAAQGREVSMQFSPSRKRFLSRLENKQRCVLCGDKSPTKRLEILDMLKRNGCATNGEDEDRVGSLKVLSPSGALKKHGDALMNAGDDDPVDNIAYAQEDDEKGPIIELGSDICKAAGSRCCHYAHENCIEVFAQNGGGSCPRCQDLATRLHITGTEGAGGREVYCKEIMTTVGTKGFTASAKIEDAIKRVKNILDNCTDSKIIVFSFFKGPLDLGKFGFVLKMWSPSLQLS